MTTASPSQQPGAVDTTKVSAVREEPYRCSLTEGATQWDCHSRGLSGCWCGGVDAAQVGSEVKKHLRVVSVQVKEQGHAPRPAWSNRTASGGWGNDLPLVRWVQAASLRGKRQPPPHKARGHGLAPVWKVTWTLAQGWPSGPQLAEDQGAKLSVGRAKSVCP